MGLLVEGQRSFSETQGKEGLLRLFDKTEAPADYLSWRSTATLASEETPKGDKNFEPFGQTDPKQEPQTPSKYRFINNYGGPYAMKMELNRTAVERFIQLSRLEGIITLSSLPYSRTRLGLEINRDFSVSAKRNPTGDQRRFEKEENPLYQAISAKYGWAIQINGQRILQEIKDKPDKKNKDEERFSREFNRYLHSALLDCLVGEKLSRVLTLSIIHHGETSEDWHLDFNIPLPHLDDFVFGIGYLGLKGRTLVRSKKA